MVLDLEQLADVRTVAEAPGVAGRRRCTTSELLDAATAAALARERPDVHVTCLDPGLVLGTGLSRQHPASARRLTTSLAPLLGAVVPLASTPRASGLALARLLLEVPAPAVSGACVDHHLRTVPASSEAQDPAFPAEVLRDGRALLPTQGSRAAADVVLPGHFVPWWRPTSSVPRCRCPWVRPGGSPLLDRAPQQERARDGEGHREVGQ